MGAPDGDAVEAAAPEAPTCGDAEAAADEDTNEEAPASAAPDEVELSAAPDEAATGERPTTSGVVPSAYARPSNST